MSQNLRSGPPILRFAAAASLLVLLFSERAWVSTYGEKVVSFKGFSVAAEIRVGHSSDPQIEADAFRREERLVEQAIPQFETLFRKIFETGLNSKSGHHRFLARHLDSQKARFQSDTTAVFDLFDLKPSDVSKPAPSVMDEGVSLGQRRLQLKLHLKTPLAPSVAHKVSASFAMAQLKGGYFTHHMAPPIPSLTPPSPEGLKAAARAYLGNLTNSEAFSYTDLGPGISRFLAEGLRVRPGMELLVKDGAKAKGYERVAGLILKWLDGQSISPEDLAAIANSGTPPIDTERMELLFLLTARDEVFPAWQKTIGEKIKGQDREDDYAPWIQPLLELKL